MRVIAIEGHLITPMYRERVATNEFRNFYLSARPRARPRHRRREHGPRGAAPGVQDAARHNPRAKGWFDKVKEFFEG